MLSSWIFVVYQCDINTAVDANLKSGEKKVNVIMTLITFDKNNNKL